MKKLMLVGFAAMGAAVAFGEAVPEISGNTYTFNLSSDDTYSTALSGAITIVKQGAGKLTLTGNNTQTGDITIEGGILGADTPDHFGKPKNVTIQNGAALDLTPASSTDTLTGSLASCTRISLAGAGPDNQGAIRRTGGGYSSSNFLANLYLTGNATYNVGVAHRIGSSIKLNGYKLTKIGGADWVLNGVKVEAGDTDGRVASIEVQAGMLVIQGNASLTGSAANKLIWNNGTKYFRFWDYTGHSLVWTLEAKKEVLVQSWGDKGKTTTSAWSGPLVRNGGNMNVEVQDLAGKHLLLDGPYFNNTGNTLSMWGNQNKATIAVGGWTNGSVCVNGNTLVLTGKGRHSFSANWFLNNERKTDRNVAFNLMDAGDVCFPEPKWVYFWGNSSSYVTSMTISNTVFRFPVSSDGQLRLGSATNGLNVLKIQDGAIVTSKVHLAMTGSGSNGAGSRNAVYMSGGELVGLYGGDVIECDAATNAVGYFEQSGGTRRRSSFSMGNGGSGFYHQKGGTVEGGTGNTTLTRGGNGVFRMTGGTATFGGDIVLGETKHTGYFSDAARATTILALSGAGTSLTGLRAVDLYTSNYYCNAVVAVNDGATLGCTRFYKSTGSRASAKKPELHLAVNGGILRPQMAWDWFDTGDGTHAKDPDSFKVYAKGLIVDTTDSKDSGSPRKAQLSALWMPITRPSGKSVSAIALPTEVANATGYVGPGLVTISGTGHGAAAVAEFDSATRRITGITVVAPGYDYDDNTTASIVGPDGKTAYACTVTMADAVTTGGLTKRGAQVLELHGANTYGGETSCEQGRLRFCRSNSYPGGDLRLAGGEIYFDNNVTLACTVRGTCAAIFGGNTRVYGGGNLDVSGVTLEITDPENLKDYADLKRVTLFTVASGKTLTGTPKLAADYGNFGLVKSGNSVKFGPQKGLILVIR